MDQRIWVLTPAYSPVGGVVKIFDYVRHALDLGMSITVACPKGPDPDSPLWRMDAFADLPTHPQITWVDDWRIAPTVDDLVFFSWPSHVREILPRLPHGFPVARLIHIVQNTRHANPTFAEGWGVRTLARPMTRIAINQQVRDAIEPFLNPTGITEVIPLGHAAEYFDKDRTAGLPEPITVGYTTWKSDIGDRVAAALEDDPRFAFEAIREPVDWEGLRALYHASDVFLCTPGPQEGFYLPGLEAMAAGCVVLTPDVGGNLAYAFFDDNCLEVPFEDVAGTAERLREVVDLDDGRVQSLRDAGRERVAAHSLDHEAAGFGALVERIRAEDSPGLERSPMVLPAHRARDRFTILTGIPRSGTTLATRLLNGIDDVVAMDEPLHPGDLMQLGSLRAVADQIEQFFREQRESAITDGTVDSKVVDGRRIGEHAVPAVSPDGLREEVARPGRLELGRAVTPGVHLVVKDLAMTTAILADLVHRFDVAAIVRNPVAVLASWETVDMPFREGHSPHAEWFNERLARALQVDDRRERQLRLLSWWFEQIDRHVPGDRIVRYEDIVTSSGAALAAVVPAAADLSEDLSSRNTNPAYADVDIATLIKDVVDRSEAPWWRHYTVEEVERLAT